MFVVLLRFSGDRSRAGRFMDGHNAWISRGLNDGVFALVGSLESGRGGAILAHGVSLKDLQQRISEDPLVVEQLVQAEILQITPSRTDRRLEFLLESTEQS